MGASTQRNFSNSRFTNTQRPVSNNATSQVETLARQLADQIIRERDSARSRIRSGKIFSTFDSVDDILPNNVDTLTRGLFSGNTGSLVSMFTSSIATAIQNTYFREIYNYPTNDISAEPQFSIAYGHYDGSGSADLTGNLNNDTPSRAIYKQYAQLLLPPNDFKFTINGTDTDHIYVLNFNRARYREKLDPGNLEINLARLSGSVFANNVHTGSNVRPLVSGDTGYGVIRLIDDSSTASPGVGEAGLVYNIVSGTIDEGTIIFNPSAPDYYGLFYPQYGIVVLDANTLNLSASFNTVTGSGVQGDNSMKLFTSISGSIANHTAPSGDNYGLQARSSEQVKSTYYFVRVKNAEYNFSNNPSYVTGSLGQLRFPTFVSNPQTYITTVGLYNDRRELLAVAKLSRPLLKSFTRAALIKVKLDF